MKLIFKKVRSLSMENQRLQAQLEFSNMIHKQQLSSLNEKNPSDLKILNDDFEILKNESFLDSTLSGTEPESIASGRFSHGNTPKKILLDEDSNNSIAKFTDTSQPSLEHMKKYPNFSDELDRKKPLTADEKISALIAMNDQELKAIADKDKGNSNNNTTNNSNLRSRKVKSTTSLVNDFSKSDGLQPKKTLGFATIELPPVFVKKNK